MNVEDLVARLRVSVPPLKQKRGVLKPQNRSVFKGVNHRYYLTYSQLDNAPEIPARVVVEAISRGLLTPTYADAPDAESWDLAELSQRPGEKRTDA